MVNPYFDQFKIKLLYLSRNYPSFSDRKALFEWKAKQDVLHGAIMVYLLKTKDRQGLLSFLGSLNINEGLRELFINYWQQHCCRNCNSVDVRQREDGSFECKSCRYISTA